MNATVSTDAATPLVEFISEAVALLESDLIMISTNMTEAADDISAFKTRFPFAFQAPTDAPLGPEYQAQEAPAAIADAQPEIPGSARLEETPVAIVPEVREEPLPPDDQVPPEVLEFFVPEAEEHLQVVTHCLLSLETNPGVEQINHLLRAMHTVKGSAAQVGLHRISHVAHRAEDVIGRLRDGDLRPSAEIIDICLEAVDILKKFLYRQWTSDEEMKAAVRALFARINRLAPAEKVEGVEVVKNSEVETE
jgi:HPt (histidine-containing phosphotransfer) domain-containing protein